MGGAAWLVGGLLLAPVVLADSGDTGGSEETGFVVSDPIDDPGGGGDGASYAGDPGRFGAEVLSGLSASEAAGDTGGSACAAVPAVSAWWGLLGLWVLGARRRQ